MFSGMNYVYEVYKEQSFSKAAENLYIAQPALSSMIKKIETKIGMPLFDRSTSPIQLTECGKKYIKTAEKIMDVCPWAGPISFHLSFFHPSLISSAGPTLT